MAVLMCSSCGQAKASSDFSNVEQRKGDGRSCRACSRRAYRRRPEVKEAARKRSRAADPDARANAYYKYRYGITRDEIDDMIEAQGGLCAVCRRPESQIVPKSGKPRRLQVDHDHRTGRPRGMVCQFCNMVLGHVDDSTEHLQRFIAYLDQHAEATFAPR